MYVYRRKCNFVCICRVVTHHASIRIQYVVVYIYIYLGFLNNSTYYKMTLLICI